MEPHRRGALLPMTHQDSHTGKDFVVLKEPQQKKLSFENYVSENSKICKTALKRNPKTTSEQKAQIGQESINNNI